MTDLQASRADCHSQAVLGESSSFSITAGAGRATTGTSTQLDINWELPPARPLRSILHPVGARSSNARIAWKADTAFTSQTASIYRPELRVRRSRAGILHERPRPKRKIDEPEQNQISNSKRTRLVMSVSKSPHIQHQLDVEGGKRPSLTSRHSSGSREQLSSSAQKPRPHVVGKRNKSSGHLTRLNRGHSSKNLAAKGFKAAAGGKINRTASHVKFRVDDGATPAADWEEEEADDEQTASPGVETPVKDENESQEKTVPKPSSPPREVVDTKEVSREPVIHASELDDSAIPDIMSSADRTAPGTPLDQSQTSLPAAAPRNMTRTQWKNALERQHTMTFTEPRQRPAGVAQSLNHMGEPDPRIDPISGKVIVRVAVKEARKDFDAARKITARNPVVEAVATLTASGEHQPRPKSRSWINPTQSSAASVARGSGLFTGTRKPDHKGKAALKPLSPAEAERKRQFVMAMKGDLAERLKDLWTHPAASV